MKTQIKRTAEAEQLDGPKYDENGVIGLGELGGLSPVSQVWGSLLGTGLASAGILVARSMKTRPWVVANAGFVGLGVVAVPAVLGMLKPATRKASTLMLATGALVALGEVLRQSLTKKGQLGEFGMYSGETAGWGQGVEILDADVDDAMGDAMVAGAFGQGVEILGDGLGYTGSEYADGDMDGALGYSMIGRR